MDKKTFQKKFAELRSKSLRQQNNSELALRRTYKKMMRELRSFIGEEYANLAQDGKLTYSILQQKGEHARFLEEVTRRLDNITPEVTKEIQSLVNETYELMYKGIVDAVEKGYPELENELKSVRATTPEVIKASVNNPINKLTLKDTLEHNRQNIIYNIRKQISVGLVTGDRYEDMVKRITDSLDGDYKKAVRIVRTEAHRVREQGNNDAAVDCANAINKGISGLVMVKIWRTGKDARVRDTHSAMEGIIVLTDEEFELPSGAVTLSPGNSGVASEDINCRCYCSYTLMTVEEYEKATGKTYGKAETPSGIAQGKDISDSWKRREDDFDFEIEDVINAQGFDGLPRVVSSEEFDKAVKESSFIAQRSYSAPSQEILDEYREQLYNGKWYVDCSTGGAQYGQGMYCAADYTGKLTDGIKAEMKTYKNLGERRFIDELADSETLSLHKQKTISGFADDWLEGKLDGKEFEKIQAEISKMTDIDYMQKYMGIKVTPPVSFTETLTLDKSAKIVKYTDLCDEFNKYKVNAGKEIAEKEIAQLAKSFEGVSGEAETFMRFQMMMFDINFDDAMNAHKKLTTAQFENANKLVFELREKIAKKSGEINEMNIGSFATLRGYDAINAEGHGESGSYTVILNRTKVIFRKGG